MHRICSSDHLRTSGRRWWRRFGCICPLADVRVCLLAARLEPLHLLVVQRGAGLRVEAGVEPVRVLHRPPVRPSPNVVSFGQPEPEVRWIRGFRGVLLPENDCQRLLGNVPNRGEMNLVSLSFARVLRLLEGLRLRHHLVAVLSELVEALTSQLGLVAGRPVLAVRPKAGVGIDLADVGLEVGARLVVPLAGALPLRVHLDAVLVRPNPVWLVAVPVGEGDVRLIGPSEGVVEREVRIEPDPESPT